MAGMFVAAAGASGAAGPAPAQTGAVALYCDVRDSRVDPAFQSMICDAFASEITLRYPGATFSDPVSGPAPADVGRFATIETFYANANGAEIRVRFGQPGAPEVAGDRVGISIADATLTESRVRRFVTSVIDRSSLPFK